MKKSKQFQEVGNREVPGTLDVKVVDDATYEVWDLHNNQMIPCKSLSQATALSKQIGGKVWALFNGEYSHTITNIINLKK